MTGNGHPPRRGANPREIAFFEKVFLRRLGEGDKLRGVELFNIGLVRDLAAAGRGLFIPARRSWSETLEEAAGRAQSVEIRRIAALAHPVLTALGAALSVCVESRAHGRFPVLFVANNAEGLAPAIRLMRCAGAFEKLVLFAHKVPSRRFARAVADIPGHVVCVCGPIADAFRECGVRAEVHVDYGIVNADAFHPATGGPGAVSADAGPSLRACLLGDLSSDWKGADTAIAAMSLLPAEYRGRIELHLKTFRDKRDFPRDSGIISHPWSGAGDIPEFLRGMDVMLSVSRNRESDGRLMETFSQTTVQGMLTGLPVIHTSIPPFLEKFDVGGGICADTPAEISAALVRLADDPALRARLGREGRATALSRYVWDTARFTRRYIGA